MTIIEHGTVGAASAVESANLAREANCLFVDAPVIGGGREAAESHRLSVLIGGADEAVASAMPVLSAMSREQHHLGEAGAGQAMKVIHNTLLAVNAVAIAEAFDACGRANIDRQRANGLLSGSSTRSFALEWLFPKALEGDFSGGAKVSILAKDLEISMESSDGGQHHPVSRAAAEVYMTCLDEGRGGDDMSVVLQHYDDRRLQGVGPSKSNL